MSMQGPDPIKLLEGAVQNTRKIYAGVKPNQMNDVTTCDNWNVKALMEHISGVSAFGIKGFGGAQVNDADHDASKGGTTLEAYDKGTKRLLELVKMPGALAASMPGPTGPMPGAQFAMILFNDFLIHGWDLAKSTKQDTNLPANLVEAAYGAMSPMFPNLSKNGTAFKPMIQTAPNASTQAKLLAGLGRKA